MKNAQKMLGFLALGIIACSQYYQMSLNDVKAERLQDDHVKISGKTLCESLAGFDRCEEHCLVAEWFEVDDLSGEHDFENSAPGGVIEGAEVPFANGKTPLSTIQICNATLEEDQTHTFELKSEEPVDLRDMVIRVHLTGPIDMHLLGPSQYVLRNP